MIGFQARILEDKVRDSELLKRIFVFCMIVCLLGRLFVVCLFAAVIVVTVAAAAAVAAVVVGVVVVVVVVVVCVCVCVCVCVSVWFFQFQNEYNFCPQMNRHRFHRYLLHIEMLNLKQMLLIFQ